jgi:hypothetical protein
MSICQSLADTVGEGNNQNKPKSIAAIKFLISFSWVLFEILTVFPIAFCGQIIN